MNTKYYFTEEHELFRQSVQAFLAKEVKPFIEEWEEKRTIPRHIWKTFGQMDYFGLMYPEKYGGLDLDFFYTVLLIEEVTKCDSAGFGAAVLAHMTLACPHLLAEGSEAIKQKYLVPSIKGAIFGCLAISEPGAGSDVANIQTKAVRDGDEYIINGSKTFITNGVYSDYLIVALKTDTSKAASGISMMLVDRNSEGLSATKLKKLGWRASDTAEIAFDNVRVPTSNLLGEEGKGFYYIMQRFELERLILAISAVAACESALNHTLKYMNERKAFGRSINKFQVLRHRIANLTTEVEAAKAFVYHVCRMFNDGHYAVKESAMAKLLATELSDKVMYECLQCFGGYGFMEDYPLARMFRDSRLGPIGGGTSEIMREIIAKMVIDDVQYQMATQHQSKINEEGSEAVNSEKTITAKQIIYSLSERLKNEKALSYQATIHFDIEGNNGGQFTVNIDHGTCQVQEGLLGNAICLIETKDDIYANVELGKTNPQQAIMQGDLKISNLAAMMEFSGMFYRFKLEKTS